jgi:lipoprotein LprG
MSTKIHVRAVALALLVGLAITGCSKSEKSVSEGRSPEEVMDLAKKNLDDTAGVHLSLKTDDLPDGVTGVLEASGVANHQPAFDGDIQIPLAGSSASVPVIAVDDKVYAKIPLTPGWSEVDPAEYGAPDPADLMDKENGVSSLLPATEGVKKGDEKRGGEDNKETLTEYTGTLPAEIVKRVIPTASGEPFDVTYLINSDGELIEADLTGQFYKDAAENTYQLVFSEYGTEKDIKKP